MLKQQRFLLALIALLVLGALIVVTPFGKQYGLGKINLGLDLRGGSQLTLQVNPTEEVKDITPNVMEAVQTVVANRLNPEGVSEIVVQTVGSQQILVQLPGVSDPKDAEQLLSQVAQLDFRRPNNAILAQVNVRSSELQRLLQKLPEAEKAGDAAALAKLQGEVQQKQKQLTELQDQFFVKTDLTGEDLNDAGYAISQSQPNKWDVTLRFDVDGGKKFAALTKSLAGTGQPLGIFLDGKSISQATVSERFKANGITGGAAIITGNFELEDAKLLANQLKGGSLPVPVKVEEIRTVGATLGQDSIRQSVYAGIGGLILVLIFMGVWYRLPGLIADVALCVYGLLTFACYVLFGVTLTLPGIAGFILSIGMAVDANILIFERTREELRSGKTLYRSIESGFYRAFTSILDSNVTTLIACGVLYWLGSGLVRGFAVTLGIGVAVSMFTAITCSRTLMFTAISLPNLRKVELFDSKRAVS
ncbi:protein translocase subunit SecD [Acaryochloris sp. CCMEE 5410]|uniref:protein translocase subunit SecD n=1 Tax=Acaryochloris sp. CCMEE 5410 TaxID=310037 RepID=UPI0002484DC3|nr:protein translocase subunit SecD [Acaryochloris sp. CCMEE 5410]KAI9130523.1 protein translocase subunit SecD [Acaryochloris sp. CCMEE 5410]